MNKSSVALSLCFSLIGAFAHADQASNKAPWLNNVPSEASMSRVEPALREQQGQGAVRDFQMLGGGEKPWMKGVTERVQSVAPKGEAGTGADDFDIQVFISTGMPDGVLRALFQQALTEKDVKRIRFVVRGFEPQKVGVLLGKLRKLLPDPYRDDVLVEVDPNAFRTYAIEAVPVFLVKQETKWFQVRGVASLDGARDIARKRGKYVQGDLFPIAEPDILAVIEDRAKKYDWEPVLQRARGRIAQNLRPGFDLPTTNKDYTTLFTPTFTAPHDISGPAPGGKGEVLIARAGQTFALLDYARLQVPVIIFDAGDPRQIKMVAQWLKRAEYKDADLFVVGRSVQPSDSRTPITQDLNRYLKRPIYPMPQRLNERFGVEAVPAIVEQEASNLRIRYFSPEGKGK